MPRRDFPKAKDAAGNEVRRHFQKKKGYFCLPFLLKFPFHKNIPLLGDHDKSGHSMY